MGGVTSADPQVLSEFCARYELEMRPDTVPELIARFAVASLGEPLLPAGRMGRNSITKGRNSYQRWVSDDS